MKLRTASEGVRFAMELESRIDGFYGALAARWPERADLLAAFEKTARRNGETIKRTYYGAITDATEGGFCFDLDAETFDTGEALGEGIAWPAAIVEAIRREDAALRFYETAASQAAGLLDDISRVFHRIALRRQETVAMLMEIETEQEA